MKNFAFATIESLQDGSYLEELQQLLPHLIIRLYKDPVKAWHTFSFYDWNKQLGCTYQISDMMLINIPMAFVADEIDRRFNNYAARLWGEVK